MDYAAIRKKLACWYERAKRDLPWRRTRDPYSIWISEIMLQQTRVAAVIPYYGRFLSRFPNVADLANAPEEEVLALWAGLGYYSRARNMQKAARDVSAMGMFPRDYLSLRALAGIGDYTASAIASIAFDLPHAVVDGNVRRVVMRLSNDAHANVAGVAASLLDKRNPGRSNQALMELGATVCTPQNPSCNTCPVSKNCGAFRQGTQSELPPPRIKPEPIQKDRTLLIIRRGGRILLTPSPRVTGFWDLPEPDQSTKLGARLGEFRHSITNSRYRFDVREGRAPHRAGWKWFDENRLHEIPLSTTAKKALRILNPSLIPI